MKSTAEAYQTYVQLKAFYILIRHQLMFNLFSQEYLFEIFILPPTYSDVF